MKNRLNELKEKIYLNKYKNLLNGKNVTEKKKILKLFKLVNVPAYNSLRDDFMNSYLFKKYIINYHSNIPYFYKSYTDETKCIKMEMRELICTFILNYHSKMNDLSLFRLLFNTSIGNELIYYLQPYNTEMHSIIKNMIIGNLKSNDATIFYYIERIFSSVVDLPIIIELEYLYDEPIMLLTAIKQYTNYTDKIPNSVKLKILNHALIFAYHRNKKYTVYSSNILYNCFKYIKFDIDEEFIANYLHIIQKINDSDWYIEAINAFIQNQNIDFEYIDSFIKVFGINKVATYWNIGTYEGIMYLINYSKENNLDLSLDVLLYNGDFKDIIYDKLIEFSKLLK